jgi:rubrerythrin
LYTIPAARRSGVIRDLTTWAETLIQTLQGHMDNEREALTQYGELAGNAPDDHVRFLMKMILEDEVRHHSLFAEMVNNLRAEISQSEPSGLPNMRRTEDRDVLLAQTKKLLELEHDDVKELQDLRREITKVEDTAWWAVIIDAMEMDNRKHIRLLEFVRDNA